MCIIRFGAAAEKREETVSHQVSPRPLPTVPSRYIDGRVAHPPTVRSGSPYRGSDRSAASSSSSSALSGTSGSFTGTRDLYAHQQQPGHPPYAPLVQRSPAGSTSASSLASASTGDIMWYVSRGNTEGSVSASASHRQHEHQSDTESRRNNERRVRFAGRH